MLKYFFNLTIENLVLFQKHPKKKKIKKCLSVAVKPFEKKNFKRVKFTIWWTLKQNKLFYPAY